jgi:hypothetical protein
MKVVLVRLMIALTLLPQKFISYNVPGETEAVLPEAKSKREDVSVERAAVTKATVRAARKLGLRNRLLSAVIGLSESTISRMTGGEYHLERDDKAFELSVLLLRLYRSLDAIVGGDEAVAKAWLNNQNIALGDKPINLIQNISGLMNVIQYLDARRARI